MSATANQTYTGPALVISGPPGVGKTTIAWRVFDLCTAAGDDPAFVDMDMMGAAWPAPPDDPDQSRLRARNLAAVSTNYRDAGSRRLIIADVLESEAHRRVIEAAINGPVVVCTLLASPDSLSLRIRTRGRDHGAGLEKLVKRAGELSAILSDAIEGFNIPTDGRSVDSIADDVHGQWEQQMSSEES